jgi:3-hydroxyisobutyrate dehydrogenase
VLPLLSHLGREIERHGPPGAGQHAKLTNQIAVAATIMGVCESLSYAKAAGLDPARVLRSVGAGTGGSALYQRLGPKIVDGDLAPGFYVRHMIKDLGLALEAAAELGLALPAVDLARRLYDRVAAAGDGELGTQALIKAYQA